ncbi:MAG: NnrS family protein [Chthoniobacterales bacterium]|nr:NnrS family protein [Chthoniobacterales bacterium]
MQNRKRSMQLFCAEPFRIFFPAGIALGIAGVSLWLLYYNDCLTSYPGTAHARMMIEGFMASFIIGFLGTAGPRITSTPPFSRAELLALLGLDLLAAGVHVGGWHRGGDALFALCLITFLYAIGKRFIRREDSPPPNFALVALGLLNGIIGALLVAVFEDAVYSVPYRFGALLLEQGFVLLPILGVAPFLLPRLLDIPRSDELRESRTLPRGWMPRAAFAAAVGLTIDGSFLLETFGVDTLAAWLRVAVIALYLSIRMPRQGRSFLGDCLRLGVVALVLGLIAETLWPQYRIGALHIVFITGFSFIVLTVAIRVVFGHSGNAHLFQKRLPFFIVVAILLLLAMLSRYVADLAANARGIHLVAAASFWIAAAVVWATKVLPKVRIPDPSE